MVTNLLKIEQVGKALLRIGIAIYIWSVVLLSFQFDKGKLWMAGIWVVLVIIPGLLLLHFKSPKTGVIGGIATFLFFLISGIVILSSDLQVNAVWQLIYLHLVKDILLMFASIVLIGESLKEIVRDKLTQPFPKA
ncbi:hypothetical protein [Indibacter alkaliphilus]|nr:hypothetical protein [Indibacter alkaliphilus]